MPYLIPYKHPPIYFRITCLLLFFLTSYLVKAQNTLDTSAPRIRNFIFTTPVGKNTVINGLAIGFNPVPWKSAQRLSINGVSISASPLDLIIAVHVIVHSFGLKKEDSTIGDRNFYIKETNTVNDFFNGLILGTFIGGPHINGINVSAIMNCSNTMNGLSIAGINNFHYSFNGILIAGLRNKTTKGRGLQIALLNRCKEGGKLVQIGLLNKIGKRTIPFINFQF